MNTYRRVLGSECSSVFKSIAQEKDGDCTQSGFQLASAPVCLDSNGPRGMYSTQTHAQTHTHTRTPVCSPGKHNGVSHVWRYILGYRGVIPHLYASFDPQILTSRTLYDALLTPEDLLKYITNKDFIHNDTNATQLTLTKPQTSGILRTIRIPLLPPASLPAQQDYQLEIKAALSEPGTMEDADILFFLSDNIHFVGIVVPDRNDASTLCYGLEGEDMFPGGVQGRRRSSLPEVNRRLDIPEGPRQAVGRIQMLFRPSRQWGACVVPDAHGFINTLGYENTLDTSRALFLDVYLDDDEEVHNIKYVNVKLTLRD